MPQDQTPGEIASDILKASQGAKAATIDHIAHHLAEAAQSDPRPRERVRARIALTNIRNWTKTNRV